MMMHENILGLSTAAEFDDRPRRYISAAHALESYLEIIVLIEGIPALDPEKMMDRVQAQPSLDSPHVDRLSDKWSIERAFRAAAQRVGEMRWELWRGVRVEGKSLRESKACSKSQARRIIASVDCAIEEALQRAGLLVRNAVRA